MAVEQKTAPIPAPSLFLSLRTFVGAVLATAATRAELAGVELEEQVTFGAKLALSAMATVLCASTAFFFLMLLIVAIFWDHKVLVLSIILGVYLLGALVFAAIARTMVAHRPRLMEQTLAELRKDVEALRKPISTAPHPKEPAK
jgi:uncharacterized membrane protein YqjE